MTNQSIVRCPHCRGALAVEDDELAALRAQVVDLHAQVSTLESREVCTVAHDGDVATCGYCQRDALCTERDTLRRQEEDALGKAITLGVECDELHALVERLRAQVADSDARAIEMTSRYDRLTVDYGAKCARVAELEAALRDICEAARHYDAAARARKVLERTTTSAAAVHTTVSTKGDER